MKLFRLIQGNCGDINKFEDEVSEAMENGYECNSEMIVKVIGNTNKPSEILLLQAMTMEDHLDFEDDDLDYTDSEELEEDSDV